MRAPGPGFPQWAAGQAAAGRWFRHLLGSRSWYCALAVGCGSACVSGGPPSGAVASPAAASSRPAAAPRVLSSYRAPLGCPSQQEYVESVESRSATLRLLPESAAVEGSERIRVRIQSDPASAGWVGELRIEGAEPLEREVRGERCQDVASALALITVLRLDRRETGEAVASGGEAPVAPPSPVPPAAESAVRPAPAAPELAAGTAAAATAAAARSTPAPTAPAPVAPPPAAAPPVTGVEPAPAPARAAPEPSLPAAPPDGAPRAASEASEARELTPAEAPPFEAVPTERRVRVQPSAEASAERNPEPSAEPGPEAVAASPRELALSLAALVGYAAAPSNALEVRLQAELDGGPAFHGLSARLGVSYAASAERTDAADLGFRLLTAQLELCPAGRPWAGIWLSVCGQLSGGALRVSVSARDPALEPEARTRPWFALGPSVQARLPLSRQLSLRALAAGSLLLMRDSLDVERTVGGEAGEPTLVELSTLYHPPLLSFELLFGLGYAF
jgi:hypothetical protein